jgi:nucleotide-binding universal stress UspA family protein
MKEKPRSAPRAAGDRGALAAGALSAVQPILVPLDGSRHALAALPVARALARLTGATIHLVHVDEPALPAQQALRRLGLGAQRAGDVVLHQTSGDPAEQILRRAAEMNSAAIVMCMYTGQKEPAGGLGTVGRAVVCNAPCPVVLVPPARGYRPLILHHVLMPYDGTPTTAAGFNPAFEIAQRAHADLIVLHAVTPGRRDTLEPGSMSAPLYIDQAQHDWPAWMNVFRRRALSSRCADRSLKTRVALVVGQPGGEVVRRAREENADLIVLAWRGNFEGPRAAVIRAVVREATCPLLLYRIDHAAAAAQKRDQ